MPWQGCRSLRFGHFWLQVEPPALYRGDELVSLPPKLVQTLLVLVEARGAVVSKARLIERIWPDTFVEEGGLTRNVYLLRRALDEPGQPSHIETVHRRGYRFTRHVIEDRPGASVASASNMPGPEPSVERTTPADGRDRRAQPGLPLVPARPRFERRRVWGAWRAGRVLRATAFSLTVLAVAGGGMSTVAHRGRAALPGEEPHPDAPGAAPTAIAVLPFRFIADQGAAVYLAHGVTDGLAERLSMLRDLRVRPAAAVLAFAGEAGDPLASGRALHADYVLEGALENTGDEADIEVRLFAVASERPVWQGRFSGRVSDLPAQLARIAQAVVRAMGMAASMPGDGWLARRETRSPRAYELYCKARYLWNVGTAESVAHAARHFEEATHVDPSYARAHAGLAAAQAYVPDWLWYARNPNLARARASAERALALDDSIASAHVTLGVVAFELDGDHQAAEREFTRALQLEAGNLQAREWLSVSLMLRGEGATAIGHLRAAAAYDPLTPRLDTLLAAATYLGRQNTEAIAWADAALARDPALAPPRLWRGLAHAALGDLEAAVEDLSEAVEHAPDRPEPLAALGYVYGLQGHRERARSILARLETDAFGEPPEPFDQAIVALGHGDTEAAFGFLTRCLNHICHPSDHLARVDPRLEPLRRDSRFRSIAKVMRARADAIAVASGS